MSNKWMETHLGKSWKTTLIGYVAAAFTAIYPLMDQDVDFSNRLSVKRYIIKLVIAIGIALMGKYSADSAQVKEVHNDVQRLKNE
jgi:DMSO/TMAO reductase YedYZ heme-binding membrane subunit